MMNSRTLVSTATGREGASGSGQAIISSFLCWSSRGRHDRPADGHGWGLPGQAGAADSLVQEGDECAGRLLLAGPQGVAVTIVGNVAVQIGRPVIREQVVVVEDGNVCQRVVPQPAV